MGKRSFDLEFKLKVVEFAKTNTGEETARKFGVNPKQVREWKKKSEVLESTVSKFRKGAAMKKRKRLAGGGRQPISLEMEQQLVDFIVEHRGRGLRVSRRSIQEKAKLVYPTLPGAKLAFKGSRGWLDKFMKRNNFSVRRKTTLAQKDPQQLFEKLVSFVMFVNQARKSKKIEPASIIAMDETPIWFDMNSSTTVDQTGTKSIVLKSTGNEKLHATVVLAAKGDGTKLKPFVVFKKGIREVNKLQDFTGIVARQNNNGWMDDKLTTDWLNSVFGKFTFLPRLLVWDSYKCHISDSTKESLKSFNTTSAVIPGGCTKYIQAPDVSWNKPFKAAVTDLYDKWLAGDCDKEYTKGGGNLKAPSKRLLLSWIKKSWDSLDSELIIKSFKTCGISTALDGSEDDEIQCMKEQRPCHPAYAMLKDARVLDRIEDLTLQEDEEEAQVNEVLLTDESEPESVDLSSDSDSD